MKRQYLSALLVVVLVVTSISFLVSCKDYTNDIGSLQSQVDKAALTTDVQTLKSQVEANAQKELATADTAKKAFDKAVANAAAISGNSTSISANTAKIEAINKSIDNMNTTIKGNAEKAVSRIDSLARAGAVTDTEIAKLQSATKAAADSAAYAIAKNKELFGELYDLSGNVSNLSGEVKNIQNTLTKWAEAKSDYYTATEIDKKLDDLADEIQNALDDSIASLRQTVEGYQTTVNALYTAVTSVSLYINSNTDAQDAFRLKFVKGKVQNNYTFGKEEKDDVDTIYTATPIYQYKKSTSFSISRSLMVRVNPVNAKLTPSMIKLIDSEGNNLDDILDVKSVEKYDGLLTKASSASGLWTVQLKLKDDVDNNTAEKLDPSGTGKHIAYALAVNNTQSQSDAISDAASRYVVSSYDITMEGTKTYTGATSIDSVRICPEGDKEDARHWKYLKNLKEDKDTVHAHVGENILIDFSQYAERADRFYVAVDYGHSKVGNEDMYDEWKSYEYSGLNMVYEVDANKNPQFSVQMGSTLQSFVKFRIFAVNCDGTFVDQKGVSFLVTVGAEMSEASVEGELVASTTGKMETGWLPISGTLTHVGTLPSSVGFTGNEGYDRMNIPATVTYAADENGTSIDDDISKAKYVKIAISSNLQYWTDGTSLSTVLKGTDGSLVVNKISVKLKKIIPTVEDAIKLMGYSRNVQYFSNNTYIAYMAPGNNPTDSPDGSWSFTDPWYGISSLNDFVNLNLVGKDHGMMSFENAVRNEQDNKYTKPFITSKRPSNITLWRLYLYFRYDEKKGPTTLIDGKTPHKTEVYFPFGPITSEKDDNGELKDLNLIVDTFQTIFTCPFDESVQKFEWKQIPASGEQAAKDVNVLTFGSISQVTDNNGNEVNILDYLQATNTYRSSYSCTLGDLLRSRLNYAPKYKGATAHLYVGNTSEESYFTAKIDTESGKITFEVVAGSTEPRANVDCILYIEVTDAFNHIHKYNLPFVVKKP